MNTDSLRYAGFWPRLSALWMDGIFNLFLLPLILWGGSQYRLFSLYYFLPSTLFILFYNVYLVRRFGGTPGKLVVGIRIRKLEGEQVGYREAILRFLPDLVFFLLINLTLLIPLFHMSDSEYHALAFMERHRRIVELAPSWYKPLHICWNVWIWGEIIVLLTNRKRRALHDFIAGTVVVHVSPNKGFVPEAAEDTAPHNP